MRSVKLTGILMDNNEFMCMGKIIRLSNNEIKQFIEFQKKK